MDEEAERRFKEMPIGEFRQKVDLALAYLRDLRRGLAAANGMLLEDPRQSVPVLDKEQAESAFQQVMELLPLSRPLPPEAKAKLQPMTEERREATEATLEALLEMDPDEFNECMEESGLPYTYDVLLKLQDEGEKLRLLGLVQSEVKALIPALEELRRTLSAQAQASLAKIFLKASVQSVGGGGDDDVN